MGAPLVAGGGPKLPVIEMQFQEDGEVEKKVVMSWKEDKLHPGDNAVVRFAYFGEYDDQKFVLQIDTDVLSVDRGMFGSPVLSVHKGDGQILLLELGIQHAQSFYDDGDLERVPCLELGRREVFTDITGR